MSSGPAPRTPRERASRSPIGHAGGTKRSARPRLRRFSFPSWQCGFDSRRPLHCDVSRHRSCLGLGLVVPGRVGSSCGSLSGRSGLPGRTLDPCTASSAAPPAPGPRPQAARDAGAGVVAATGALVLALMPADARASAATSTGSPPVGDGRAAIAAAKAQADSSARAAQARAARVAETTTPVATSGGS
jgi:hypothetical protein